MILSSRSAKAGEKSLRKLVDLLVEVVFIYVIIDFETSDYSEATSSSEGYPVKRQIFSIWSSVELPGKSGF